MDKNFRDGFEKVAASRLSKYVAKKFFGKTPKEMGGVRKFMDGTTKRELAVHSKVKIPNDSKVKIPEAHYTRRVKETRKNFQKAKPEMLHKMEMEFGNIPSIKNLYLKRRLKNKRSK